MKALKKILNTYMPYNPFVGRPVSDITWTPNSGIWIENFYPYRLDVDVAPMVVSTSDVFSLVKYEMEESPEVFGVYRETWIGHVSTRNDMSSTHRWYFTDTNQIKNFVKLYLARYDKRWDELHLHAWVRGPNDEVLDHDTLEEMTMEYPHCVEISDEHDGVDIQDWLIENGMGHLTDWKAISMRHKGVYAIYFRDANKAVMTKLRWGGIGF